MNLYEAIFQRSSVRRFQEKPIEGSMFSKISRYIKMIEPLNNEPFDYEIIDTKAKGLSVSGRGIINAPDYLVFYTDTQNPSALMNAGYILEQVSLYVLTQHLGSCFQANIKAAVTDKDIRHNMKAAIGLALGYPVSKCFRDSNEAKRKTINSLAVFKDDIDNNIMYILNAARLSPSSQNKQPWRFVVYKNRIHLFCKREQGLFSGSRTITRIDMGVVISHIMLTIDELWLEGSMHFVQSIAKQSFNGLEYIASFSIAN